METYLTFPWKGHKNMKQDLHAVLMPTAARQDLHHNFANPEIR